jgi:subtilase family serine protease
MNESFSNILIGQLSKTKLEKEDLNSVIKDFNLKVLKSDPNRLEKEFQAKKSLLFNLQAELTQLENNLEFFSNSSVENPLFKNVEKQISSCQSKIDNAQNEYINLKQIRNTQNKSTIASEEKAKASDNQQLLESGEED